MTAATVAKAVSAGRLAFGIGMMVAPSTVMRGWIGADAERATFDLVTRSLGAREVLLGFIGVHVADRPGVGKRTIGAMAFLDATDLVVSIAHRNSLPKSAVPLISGIAGGAVVSQLWAARELP